MNGIHCLGNRFRVTQNEAAVLHRAKFNPVRAEGDDLPVLDAHYRASEREDGRKIGGEAGEALADANHQPGTFLNGIQLVVIGAPDNKSIVPLQVTVSQANGVNEIVTLVDIALDGMDAGFAVVLGANGETLGDELLAQFNVVDHVAVMRPHHVAIRIEMRLGVDLRGLTKCGPAQLGYAALTGHFGKVIFDSHILHAAGILAQVNFGSVERGGADRVVSAIREPAGGVDEDGAERLFVFSHNAENATHG